MPATYDLLGKTTAPGSSATLEVTGIPATHNDLVIVFAGRSTDTTDPENGCFIRFNGETGYNKYFEQHMVLRDDNSTGVDQNRNANKLKMWSVPCNGVSWYHNLEINIQNYVRTGCPAGGEHAFMCSMRTVREDNNPGDSSSIGQATMSFVPSGTDAFSAVSFHTSGSANWASGSNVRVYGIKSS